MARRRSRRPRRRRSNNMLVFTQILVLGLILAFILAFRGSISRTTTAFVESFSAREDVRVQGEGDPSTNQPEEPAQQDARGGEDSSSSTAAPAGPSEP